MPESVMADEQAITPDEPESASRLDEQLEAGARAEADQLKAELAPVAEAAGFYFQELIRAATPDDLARELVLEWHRLYFDDAD